MINARSLINFTFDLWTSPGCQALFGITAHFINKEYERRDVVISLQEVKGRYTGENLGEVLCQILQSWDISH